MLLRPRQHTFVQRSMTALHAYKNTLGVAPTGAGKTIMLSGVIGEWIGNTDAKACVLAHRDELIDQNESKFIRVNSHLTTSVVNAHEKCWQGQTTFAMVQTLSHAKNLKTMPSIDVLAIDEAHHATTDSYRRVIDQVRDKNPDAALFGVTATPNRGDRQGLNAIFSNVADQITLAELILSGHLVPPRTYVVDIGAQQALATVAATSLDFDMSAVDRIMNKAPITQSVIQQWKEKAGDRQTVVFCSTIRHAQNVAAAFIDANIKTEIVHGQLSRQQRQAALRCYEKGDAQVIVNVAVLTEGWDHPPTSCVILLRPSSLPSTLIQMIGRGLRTIDPEYYPGIIKKDCVVLDFGTSTLLHGSLEQRVDLQGKIGKGEAVMKTCPACDSFIPAASLHCALCGHQYEKDEPSVKDELVDFTMSEIDLLNRSSFQWCDVFNDEATMMATGFEAWAGLFFLHGHWYAMGGTKQSSARLLAKGERIISLAAADDWLNQHETENAAQKSKKWLQQSATDQQLRYLPAMYRQDFGLTRYHASCLLAFQFNKQAIQQTIFADAHAREHAKERGVRCVA